MKKSFIIALLAVGLTNASENENQTNETPELTVGLFNQVKNFFISCQYTTVEKLGSAAAVITNSQAYQTSAAFAGKVSSTVTNSQAYQTSAAFADKVSSTVTNSHVYQTSAEIAGKVSTELTSTPTRHCALIATSAAAAIAVINSISKKIESKSKRNIFRGVSYAAIVGLALWKGYKALPVSGTTLA